MTAEKITGENLQGPIRLGMVGGGQGAFIGAVHRFALRLDDKFKLTAGAFSSDPVRAKTSGSELGLPEDRVYSSYEEMAKIESQRGDGIEVVSIVTPNHLHYPVSKAFLERGFHVICDKPLTSNLADAKSLVEVVKKSGKLFVLTHNYTGYPVIRQAREMVANGELGDIRLIQAEYVQDWLTNKLEDSGHKQAEWRTDPARSGLGGCVGDIGTHAYNLACFVSGLSLESLCADLTSFVSGRILDDNVSVLLRFSGGAKGMLWASQVAPGNENALTLRVYGTKGGIEWDQQDPNYLWFTPFGEPKRKLTRGGAGTYESMSNMIRVPPGHPEGYVEGFANIYKEFAELIKLAREGKSMEMQSFCLPTEIDGLSGMEFIDACVQSSNQGSIWVSV